MDREQIIRTITEGRAVLGLEFGSTRIKAVLIGDDFIPFAQGNHDWENRLEDGVWTYHMDDIWGGLQDCYADLVRDVKEQYGVELTKLAALGISGMMHGYLAFDKEGNLLVPFRTWRNTMTEQSAAELTAAFDFNIPQRWTIAHIYQAVLNGEAHVPQVDFVTTLAGYIHWQLTGQKVVGVGEASGIFPIDSETNDYNEEMLDKMDGLLAAKGVAWKIRDVLPKVKVAGEDAGVLTAEGAKLLDPSGKLEAGAPMAAPEGDAGTGMTATNSVAARTGNVSAGTSIFAMIVLEKALSKVYEEIDMVTTPTGKAVAMVHCNNCTSDINAWVGLLKQSLALFGAKPDMNELYTKLFQVALEGAKDCGGIISYNYFSGEGVTHLNEGMPMLLRKPDADMSIANFMRTHLNSAIATLVLGMRILRDEKVKIDSITGHGGYFKTPEVGQKLLAAASGAPVTVTKTAGEGGPWGMALLAAYLLGVQNGYGETLEKFLSDKVFADSESLTIAPDADDEAGFSAWLADYEKYLPAEKAAIAQNA